MGPVWTFGPIATVTVGGAATMLAGGQPVPPDPTQWFVPLGALGFVLLILLAAVRSGLRRERDVQGIEPFLQQTLVDRERRQETDHVVVRPGLEDHDAFLEAAPDDRVPVRTA